jgi:hypothetical protein
MEAWHGMGGEAFMRGSPIAHKGTSCIAVGS